VAVDQLAGFDDGFSVFNTIKDFVRTRQPICAHKKLNVIRRHIPLPLVEAGAPMHLSVTDA
jgi:hypothetical protein